MSGPTRKTPFPGIGSIGSAPAGGADATTTTHATNPAVMRIAGDILLSLSPPPLVAAYAEACRALGEQNWYDHQTSWHLTSDL